MIKIKIWAESYKIIIKKACDLIFLLKKKVDFKEKEH